jgi:hypothetical protein
LLIAAYAATVFLASPFLLFFFFGHQYPPGATGFSADAASFVLPPPLVALTRHGTPFAGARTEGYLGVPLIVLIALYLWRDGGRGGRGAWLIGAGLLLAAIASLGSHVLVRGHRTSIPAPWLLVAHLPVLRYAIPVRFAVFVVLPAALAVALWLSGGPLGVRGLLGRWGLALLAIAFIAPDVGSSAWDTHVSDPAFFRTGAYKAYLKPGDHVLTIPAWGPNERWQADTGFAFKLADGYAGNPFPSAYTRYPTWSTLMTGRLTPDYAPQLRRFVAAKRVSAIVVDTHVPGPWTTLFGSLGVRPVAIGGVLVYRLGRGSS